jgi:hypothetical protein
MIRAVLTFVAASLVLSDVHAQSLCPSIKPGRASEGAMPIPESEFTKQAAERELRKLEGLLGPDGLLVDPPVWRTSFVYLEGWYLKRQALEAKNRGGPPHAIADFCDFMRKQAYVRH